MAGYGGVQGGLKNIYDSIRHFQRPTLPRTSRKFDVPTLVLHGDDDQIVPIKDSSKKSAKLIKGAKEIYYREAARSHGYAPGEVNADLLKFLRSVQEVGKAALNLAATQSAHLRRSAVA